MNHNLEDSKQLWRGVSRAHNNLVYVAAGAISLSITFLGYILSITPSVKSVLRLPIFQLPIIYILFGSWIFLCVSILCSVAIQFFIERYIFDSASLIFVEELKEKTRTEDKSNVDGVIEQVKSGVKFYNPIVRWTSRASIIFFFIGISFLVFFVIVLVNNLL